MYMDKDKLRHVFGQAGDVNEFLADLFGEAYLDHPDDTFRLPKESVPEGFEITDISEVVRRKIENTERISCERNKELLTNQLEFLRTNGQRGRIMDMNESWQAAYHSGSCPDASCEELFLQVMFENR